MATFRLNKDRDKSLVRDLDQARKIFSEKLLNKKIVNSCRFVGHPLVYENIE